MPVIGKHLWADCSPERRKKIIIGIINVCISDGIALDSVTVKKRWLGYGRKAADEAEP